MKYALIACVILLATACGQSKPAQTKVTADTATTKKTTGIQYTCTMHPDVVATKPGTCPKCGMELVEKDNSK